MLPMPDLRRAGLRLQLALNRMGKDYFDVLLPWLQRHEFFSDTLAQTSN